MDVMDKMVYEALSSYYHALGQTGYMPYTHAQKLLLLLFYKDFVYQDYRGLLKPEDYHLIEQALYCLYGSTCLIPYPDYLKMGRLCLGDTTELAHRVKTLEELDATEILKELQKLQDGTAHIVTVDPDEVP